TRLAVSPRFTDRLVSFIRSSRRLRRAGEAHLTRRCRARGGAADCPAVVRPAPPAWQAAAQEARARLCAAWPFSGASQKKLAGSAARALRQARSRWAWQPRRRRKDCQIASLEVQAPGAVRPRAP